MTRLFSVDCIQKWWEKDNIRSVTENWRIGEKQEITIYRLIIKSNANLEKSECDTQRGSQILHISSEYYYVLIGNFKTFFWTLCFSWVGAVTWEIFHPFHGSKKDKHF